MEGLLLPSTILNTQTFIEKSRAEAYRKLKSEDIQFIQTMRLTFEAMSRNSGIIGVQFFSYCALWLLNVSHPIKQTIHGTVSKAAQVRQMSIKIDTPVNLFETSEKKLKGSEMPREEVWKEVYDEFHKYFDGSFQSGIDANISTMCRKSDELYDKVFRNHIGSLDTD